VGGMLSATRAVFRHFKSLGIILFVLLGVVVAFFALCAREGDLISHILCGTSYIYLAEKPANCLISAKHEPAFNKARACFQQNTSLLSTKHEPAFNKTSRLLSAHG
jgi:hypothetical protein